MTINSGFSHWKWWFSIVMLVYQRVIINCDLGEKKKDVLMAIGCLSTAQVESYWMMPQGSNPARLRWRTSSPLMFFVRKWKFHGIPFCRAMENLQGGWFPPTFPLLLDVPHILKTRIRFQFGKIEVDQFVFFDLTPLELNFKLKVPLRVSPPW